MVDSQWWQLLLLGTGCLAVGYLLGKRGAPRLFRSSSLLATTELEYDGKKERHEVDKMAAIMDDFKMVLVVRNDLKMGKGKIAAQCSHATLGLYRKILSRAPMALQRWEMCGQVKVVTRVENEDEMLVLQTKAKFLKLASHITIDAGKTQIAPNSRTVLCILGPADLVDEVTGGLKLL